MVKHQSHHCQPQERGPFDIIGDIHGCTDELEELLEKLGYEVVENRTAQDLHGGTVYRHPLGRKAVFLGDLVDRGPRILDTLRIVHNMVSNNAALCVLGNHDDKLLRHLKGNPVQIRHGLEQTVNEINQLPEGCRHLFRKQARDFLQKLPPHYMLDDGRLIVAHAGLKESLQGKVTDRSKDFALYGDPTGEKDTYGLPIRRDWAARYEGKAAVVYGHTPNTDPQWKNNTLNVDTGCVMGGYLTAVRYPERDLVRVPARRVYYESPKPFPINAEKRPEARSASAGR